MTAVRYVSYDVVLEPDQWQVRAGSTVTKPEPKVFELLCYLMRHAGRVVSKAELLDALWAGDVVGESVLTRCVSCARKVLLDDSKTPRFIRTIHGRGYEFIAPVNEVVTAAVRRDVDERRRGDDAGILSPPQPGERGFVGRRAEAQLLRDALRSVGAAGPAFVLLSGEAGIGKTRLLHEVTRTAPPGVEIHFGYCSPVAGAPPFLVFQQCFRSIIRLRTIKTALRAFGANAHEARRLLLGTDRGALEDNPAWDSASKRFRTFDAVAEGLAELGRQRPLVLVLDDLHFADLGSLLLLEFLVQQRTPNLLMIAAVRDAEPALDEARAATLANVRAACASEITLLGLSADEVKQFVELRLDDAPELARSLHARTGGNPFFLSVLTLGQSLARGSDAPLPTALRQAVSHRLAVLDLDCLGLLKTASVCGREFDVSVLAGVSGLPLERCRELLAAGSEARLIAALGGGDYRFVHDLIREVLYAEMSAEQRACAHLALGRMLENIQEYQQARHAAMLAHHFAEGAHYGGATRALDLSIRAGAFALRNFVYEEAIEQFTRASRLLAHASEADHPTECAVLLDLGLAQISAGQREAGQTTLNLAAAKARELGATAELASVALSLSPGLFAIEVGGYDPVLVGLLREALAQVGQDNPKLRGLLLARLALALYWADTFDERVSICDEAARLATSVGTDDVKAAVITARALALSRPRNLAERQLLSQQAVELCGRVSDHHGLLLNRLHRASLLLEAGDIAAANFEADSFRKLAEAVHQPQALWIAQALQACRLLLDGRLAQVEGIAAVCLQTGQRVRDHNALQTFGVHLTLVRVEQGRGGEMLDAIRNFAASYPRTVAWRAVYAFVLWRAGQRQACALEYESIKSSDFALPDDLLWQVSMAWFAELCHAHADADGARTLYERLAPWSGRVVVIGFGIASLGSVDRYLGQLSATLGDGEAAARHYDRALAVNRRVVGALPLAHTLFDYARLLALSPAGRSKARELLDEAAQIAQERGLTSLQALLGAVHLD